MKRYNIQVRLIDEPTDMYGFTGAGGYMDFWLTQRVESLRKGRGICSNIESRYIEVHIREVTAE